MQRLDGEALIRREIKNYVGTMVIFRAILHSWYRWWLFKVTEYTLTTNPRISLRIRDDWIQCTDMERKFRANRLTVTQVDLENGCQTVGVRDENR